MLKLRLRRGNTTIWQGKNVEDIVVRDAFIQAGIARKTAEVTAQYWNGTHWKRWALFSQWPLPEEKSQ